MPRLPSPSRSSGLAKSHAKGSKAVKLDVLTFGRALIESQDLDPLYVILWNANFQKEILARWLLSYFCFYNVGLSCWVIDQKSYWRTMEEIPLGGTKFPRGAERRHFRGEFAVKAVAKLQQRFPEPIGLFNWLSSPPLDVRSVAKKVKTLYGFGEWISWKVPDIAERLDLIPVTFADRDVDIMFDSSLKGAQEVSRRYAPSDDPLMAAHKYLVSNFRDLTSPPRHERAVNVQETETVFCKWKSHLNGHYPLGKDIKDIHESLERYQQCPSSQLLLSHLKPLQSLVKKTLSSLDVAS